MNTGVAVDEQRNASPPKSSTPLATNPRLRPESLIEDQRFATPTRLRVIAVVCVIAVALGGIVAWLLTDRLVSATDTIETSTGPVLIDNQGILASLAEANAAGAAVHLAGGDPEQQRVFDSALRRANVGLERVARVVGDDEESHARLADIGSSITTYAARVEGARVASVEQLPGAAAGLNDAINLLRDEITPDVVSVTDLAQARLERDVDTPWYLLAVGAIALAAIILVVAQLWMARRFSRLLNLPLVLATLALVVLGVWLTLGFVRQQDNLAQAQDGAYGAIETSAQIQSIAFEHRASETAAVINRSSVDLSELRFVLADRPITSQDIVDARAGSADGIGLLFDAVREADSPREHAAAAEMLERWARYRAESDRVQQAIQADDFDAASTIIRGGSNSAFTGFNTSVEGALFDNRSQFDGAVSAGRDALNWVRVATVALTALAALATWWGFSLRMREYR